MFDSVRRPGRIVVAALLVVCVAAAAHASERGRAERLYTKGLAELHAGRNDAAIALFQQAVAADPKDMHALYYRGLGYGHAGHYDLAVADLKVVVAANDPALERAHLELGYALFRLDRLDESAAELTIASQKGGRSAGEATMLLGIVETRRGNNEAARSALARVESLDPAQAVPAHYYMGLAAYRTGDHEGATEQFTWVKQNGGNSEFAKEASDFLDRMQQGGGARPYELHALFALEYDSNVVLAPDDNTLQTALGVTGKDDGRAVMGAGGRYAVVRMPNFHVALGYDFLQTLHFDLDSFDVQTHRVGAQSEWTHGQVALGLSGFYEYDMLDEESLMHGGNLLPYFRYDEGTFGHTEVYYRMRGRNFVLSPYSPVRDSFNHAAGARQFFSLGAPGRDVFIGYRFDADRADVQVGKQYDYDGNQFEAGVDWSFAHNINAGLLYAYKLEDYAGASRGNSPTNPTRDDDEHLVAARVEKMICPYTWLFGSYVFHRNISNQDFFDYTRHIASLGVEVRY